MYQRHEICPLCGLSTTPANMIRHMRSHENGNFEKRQKFRYTLDHDDLNCKFCGKECKNRNSLINHEMRCKENPDRIESSLVLSKFNSGREPWNKGLTKETDERIVKQVQSYKETHPSRKKRSIRSIVR